MSSNFEILSDEFHAMLGPDPKLDLLTDELEFAEGVCWLPECHCVIVSDFPNNRIMRWDEDRGIRVFRQPSDCANGNACDADGRVLSCLTRGRTVVRLEHDGAIVPIASHYEGGKFTSPNDIVVKSDGTIWFTDPDYGFLHPEFGHGDKPEQDRNRVYRVDSNGEVSSVIDDFDKPNGIAFSPDESVLYVGDTGRTHGEFRNHQIVQFDVSTDGDFVSNPNVFTVIEPGVPDGFRCDINGNLFVSAGDGIQVFDPEGNKLGTIFTPEVAANCSFGMSDRQRLFIGATSSLWSIDLNTQGAI